MDEGSRHRPYERRPSSNGSSISDRMGGAQRTYDNHPRGADRDNRREGGRSYLDSSSHSRNDGQRSWGPHRDRDYYRDDRQRYNYGASTSATSDARGERDSWRAPSRREADRPPSPASSRRSREGDREQWTTRGRSPPSSRETVVGQAGAGERPSSSRSDASPSIQSSGISIKGSSDRAEERLRNEPVLDERQQRRSRSRDRKDASDGSMRIFGSALREAGSPPPGGMRPSTASSTSSRERVEGRQRRRSDYHDGHSDYQDRHQSDARQSLSRHRHDSVERADRREQDSSTSYRRRDGDVRRSRSRSAGIEGSPPRKLLRRLPATEVLTNAAVDGEKDAREDGEPNTKESKAAGVAPVNESHQPSQEVLAKEKEMAPNSMHDRRGSNAQRAPPPPASPPPAEQSPPAPPRSPPPPPAKGTSDDALEEGESVATLTAAQRRRQVRSRLKPLKDRVFHGCSQPDAYQKVDESKGGLLGVGTFGEVSRARHIATGAEVALKKIKIQMSEAQNGMPITAIREVKLLKKLDHPNICPVVDMVYEQGTPPGAGTAASSGTVYMVLPYMQHDLNGLIERLDSEDKPFTPAQIKLYMRQLLEGTLYLHQNKILHRDIKAANILISNDGSLRIADFGLARPYHDPGDTPRETRLTSSKSVSQESRQPAWMMDERSGQPGWKGGDVNYTGMVVTRWYRPPELLAGERKYGPAVDMWGLGCLLAEMILRRPLFKGSSEINQLELISELCGSPSEAVYPGWSTHLSGVKNLDNSGQTKADKNEKGRYDFGNKPRRVREKFMGMVRTELADLIDRLLVLDPRKRLTAEGALAHKWFDVEPLPADPASLPQYPDSKEANKNKRQAQHQHAHLNAPKPASIAMHSNHPHPHAPPAYGMPGGPTPMSAAGPPGARHGPYAPPHRPQPVGMPRPSPMYGGGPPPPPMGMAPYASAGAGVDHYGSAPNGNPHGPTHHPPPPRGYHHAQHRDYQPHASSYGGNSYRPGYDGHAKPRSSAAPAPPSRGGGGSGGGGGGALRNPYAAASK